jgi:N-methylhydantoinase B
VVLDGTADAEATAALRANLGTTRRRNGFGFNPARVDFERVWTLANYERLTTLLAKLPVEWRFFVKHRVFESIEHLPEPERSGGGDEVERAFRQVAANYTQLKAFVSSAPA